MKHKINTLKAVDSEENYSGLVYNFGAGPAMLPREVMQHARAEFLDWHGAGMSVMEMSHRSDEFLGIAEQTEADFREVLAIPENYKVLFLQGGASSQFAMVPLNLLAGKNTADYFHTGIWSGKAIKEAERFCKVNVIADENNSMQSVPQTETWSLGADAAYVYYTDNETISGVQFPTIPDVGDVPLVTDMTSSLLTMPLDVSRYGVIFAGAQKNIGPSGLVVVIVREDLIGHAAKYIPSMYDYAVQAKNDSMYNTPPTYSWYMSGLALKWIKEQGGLGAMEKRSHVRSSSLYQAIDESDFYNNPIEAKYRSRMNVIFTLIDDSLNEKFASEAKVHGLAALEGHRSVGGMRASMYNAMPEEGVNALITFMQEFERANG
jgi:phosphoserine aminotransferase